jgi:hypothetical protein
MTDWIEHDGGPQPVADDVWVERPNSSRRIGPAHWFDWTGKCQYHVLNQHLIDAARLDGIRLGLEAAHMAIGKGLNDKTPLEVAATIMRAEITIVELDPETIAKEAAR